MTLRKVQRGSQLKIPSEAYNAFVDAALSDRAKRHDVRQDPGDEFRQSGIIKVKNESEEDLARYSVLELSEPIVDPEANLQQFKNQVSLRGVKPVDPTKRATFCVLLEPLQDGAIGRAIVAGVTPVQINVHRERDNFAEIEPDVTASLRSVPYGTL
jgi:hypothetical protein